MLVNVVSFDEFESIARKAMDNKRDEHVLFRGEPLDVLYPLSTSLGRRYPLLKKIYAGAYYDILKDVVLNQGIAELYVEGLPERCPYRISNLVPLGSNEEEAAQYQLEFKNVNIAIAMLRHYGFPSPFLDCSKNPLVAAFFASAGGDSAGVIYVLKIKNKFAPSSSENIIVYPYEYLDGCHENHERQESYYMLNVFNDDVFELKYNTQTPFFRFWSLDQGIPSNITIEKYIITDSRQSVLDRLKTQYGKEYSPEGLLTDVPPHTSKRLQELADEKFPLG
jgi:hypothetical protein